MPSSGPRKRLADVSFTTRALSLGVAIAASSVTVRGAGAPSTDAVTLEWSAPQECPDASRVSAEIARLLGDSAASRGRHVDARANVMRTPAGGYRVELATAAPEGKGRRSLDGSTCDEVADATALIVALTVDPELSPPPSIATPRASAIPSASTAPSAATSSAPPAPPPSASPSAAPVPSEPTPPRASHAYADASVTADVDTLPNVAIGFALGGGWSEGRVRVEASVLAIPSRPSPTSANANVGADFWLLGIAARGLYTPWCGTVCWYVGGGFELDHLHGAGFGVDFPRQGSTDFVGLVGTTALVWPLVGPLLAHARLEGIAPLRRQSFVLEGIGEVDHVSAIALRVFLGTEVHF